MNTHWITDRAPTEADADKHGFVYAELKDGRRTLMHIKSMYAEDRDYVAFIPLNLPELPKPKTQEELDGEAWSAWYQKPGSPIGKFTSVAWHAGCAYARSDLRKKLREIIEEYTYTTQNKVEVVCNEGLQGLRALAQEEEAS